MFELLPFFFLQGRTVGTEDPQCTQKSAVKKFKKMMVNLRHSRPALVGRWQDLNCIKNGENFKFICHAFYNFR